MSDDFLTTAIFGHPDQFALVDDPEAVVGDATDYAAEGTLDEGQVAEAWPIYYGRKCWIACFADGDEGLTSRAFPTEEAARAAIARATQVQS